MFRVLTPSRALPELTWSAGHGLTRRQSRWRRGAMFGLMLLLWGVIGAYWYLTDGARVRGQAEQALSGLIGGEVKIESATLSIFEGLRLDRVQVLAGATGKPDALLFTARTLLVSVDVARLIRGQFQPTRIVAIDPHVRLAEDAATGRWNWQRLAPPPGAGEPSTPARRPARLPEILLRNARVEYARVRDGALEGRGAMSIEAQLTPDVRADGHYRFNVQSRGASAGLGPRVSGTVNLQTGRVEAKLVNVEFGRDVRTMLPAQIQRWWAEHQLTGRVDVPRLVYSAGGSSNDFLAQVDVADVALTVNPAETQSDDELWRRSELTAVFDMLRSAGVDDTFWISRTKWLIEPQPVRLENVTGTFVFRPDGIELLGIEGGVSGNRLRIEGQIDGYRPDSPLRLSISSAPEIVLAKAPRVVNTLPPQVRESYDHLRPEGRAAIQVRVQRPARGARIEAEGLVKVLDGAFTFDRFPYPVSRATGQIVFGPDPKTGMDKLELIGLRGFGIVGGPNEHSPVQVDGIIAPLNAEAGVTIRIRGRNVSSEPALMHAFPPMTRRALSFLDAPGKGDWPKFTGDFTCDVFRPIGHRMPWTTSVDINIRDGEGALRAFPYHLSGVEGVLKVRDDHVEIIDATMHRDGARVVIGGRVDWGRCAQTGQSGVRPRLRVTAQNVPIDQNLLDALPETHRTWLKKLGVGGRFDLAGEVRTMPGHEGGEPEVDFDFDVALGEGTIRPAGGALNLTGVTGELNLKPERMSLRSVRGRRGHGEVVASGDIEWPGNRARVDVSVGATNLALDSALKQVLPEAARAGWDLVRPEGTVDALIRFAGDVDTDSPRYEVTILPRKLAVTPTVFPCRFSDVTGRVHITPGKVELTELIARRGTSRVVLGGGGELATGFWNLTVSADGVKVDDELIEAMPASLGELARGAGLGGSYDVTFSKLRVLRDPETSATKPSMEDQLEFAANVATRDGSLTIGVPVRELHGRAEFSGISRAGKLGALAGRLDIDGFRLGTLPVSHFTADINKPADSELIRMTDLRCDLAGGHVAGSVDWHWPERGAPRYGVSLVLRDADVRELTENAPAQLSGRLTASLALEGGWDDSSTRRGRGDVVVEGQEMYRIPILLGLLQITNLALPINRPFTQATARYGIDGNRVTFESVELSAQQMRMRGSGYLDFADRQVRMTFVTDATNWLKVPIVGDLLQGARHELLQIHVRGSLQEPKVTAGSLQTITTTIDEVFRGGDRR